MSINRDYQNLNLKYLGQNTGCNCCCNRNNNSAYSPFGIFGTNVGQQSSANTYFNPFGGMMFGGFGLMNFSFNLFAGLTFPTFNFTSFNFMNCFLLPNFGFVGRGLGKPYFFVKIRFPRKKFS